MASEKTDLGVKNEVALLSDSGNVEGSSKAPIFKLFLFSQTFSVDSPVSEGTAESEENLFFLWPCFMERGKNVWPLGLWCI